MSRLFALSAFGLLAGAVLFIGWQRVRAEDDDSLSGPERIERARKLRGAKIRERFAAAGVDYPARELFLRGFKFEGELELWARADSGPFHLVATFPVLKASGVPGPKRRAGDRQVPEGFYVIDRLNPRSLYHLSLGLDYPNASDRVRSNRVAPGSDIFIHGKAVTIGCLPLGDEGIEELYLAVHDTKTVSKKPIEVHIFPARMSGDGWTKYRTGETARKPELAGFWDELQPAYAAFETRRIPPEIKVSTTGSYTAIPR